MQHTLTEAVQRLLDGEPLHEFCDWFAPAMANEMQREAPVAPRHAQDAVRYQRHVARQLWAQLPVPANRWRARGLPRPDRNAPCHCGSGRKYKQCCAEFESMPLPLASDQLLVLALDGAPPHLLTPEAVRQVPAQALAAAALNWNDNNQAEKTVAVLTPLFAAPERLDARHEMALDGLLDALLDVGRHVERRTLLDRMAQHPDKALATTARARLVSILADQGEVEQAWKLFHDTTRLNPNDPQLWPLELTLLLTQGRQDEARVRAPLLAARARKAGLDDLAGALLRLAHEGMAPVGRPLDDTLDDPQDMDFVALVKALPPLPDPAALQALYRLERHPVDDHDSAQAVSLRPGKTLASLAQRWRRRFLVGKPFLTELDGDVEVLLESLPEALAFLQNNPQGWVCAEVLDDLLLAARALCDADCPLPVLRAAERLAQHALAVLRTLAGDAQVHWVEADNRPLLRALAVAVDLANLGGDTTKARERMVWAIALNPNDNHGWRAHLAPLLIEQGQPKQALDLMAHYPDDMPPSEHIRAVALFSLGRAAEAETVLRAAHQAHPLFLSTLLPQVMDAPPPEPGPGVRIGGAEAAWMHRVDWQPMWVKTGALAWVRALQLPDPPPRPATRPAAKKAPKAPASKPAPTAPFDRRFGAREEKRLRKTCSDYPRLHGFLHALAWSPQIVMPNDWLNAALELHDRMPNSRTEATAQKALTDVMNTTLQLYNHISQTVFDHRDRPQPPLDGVRAALRDVDDAALAWAAGFVAGAELAPASWARAGHKVHGSTGPFGPLRALAARAPLQAGQPGVLDDQDRPLLHAVADATQPAQTLITALTALWPAASQARR
jgi:yecA family protein